MRMSERKEGMLCNSIILVVIVGYCIMSIVFTSYVHQ